MYQFFRRGLWIFLFVFATALFSQEPELLKEKDVNHVMQQIFEQHVDKKEISKDILKHSFKIFLEQFDSEKTYLLESEVQSFINPSDAEMAVYIDQYKKGNFSDYDRINDLIQKSILRAQQLRLALINQSKAELFSASKKAHQANDQEYLDPDTKAPFAKTTEELNERIKKHLEQFIHLAIHRFGEPSVMSHQNQVLSLYNTQLKNYEEHYLFLNEQGQPLPAPEKENLRILHILKALANSLDSHTKFFDAAEAYDMRVHLEKELHGIGVVLQQGIDGAVISQLIQGGPAERSGLLRVNDRIVEIDGKLISGESFEKIMELLRGDDGTSLKLKIKRVGPGNEQFIVDLKRAPIAMNTDRLDISYETFGNGIIGKLTLHSFYQSEDGISSEKDLRDAITQLKKQGNLQGLILDLRDNGGGFLSQAIKVAGLFITNGVVVISKYSNGEEQFYRDIDGKKAYDGPLIILTSKATASAAEIVAEALQDYGVALVVGDEHTYGKGSIQSQTVTDNKSTSYFKVTVGKYYTVSGKTPQIYGVKSDIVVAGPFSNEHLGEEYLEYPLTPDTIPPAFDDKLSDVDPQYKAWFLKYYTPTLQHPTQDWKKMLPSLKKNSLLRLSHNEKYQAFLKKIEAKVNDEDENSSIAVSNDDLQLNEAVNIMKDMIVLHSHWNIHAVGAKN